ncbi:MAG: zinc metalloprotease HtpX [Candidatus Odinarchaeia archaeon]
MSLKLKLSMITSVASIIGLTTLVFVLVIQFLTPLPLYYVIFLIVPFNLIQWLIAPYIIEKMFRIKYASPQQYKELHAIVEEISRKSGIKKPMLMIAEIDIPNAFAYGNPLTGSRVAVTRGLLNSLTLEEIEGVLGHEIGHIKHRDVQIMMFLSLLPAIFYYLGYILLWSRYWGSSGRDDGGSLLAALGGIMLAMYFILTLFTLHFSRMREYYADEHSAKTIPMGARKLSTGLIKIHREIYMRKKRAVSVDKGKNVFSFTQLLIADPNQAEATLTYDDVEADIQKIKEAKLSLSEKLLEIFSTHPHISKRIARLSKISSAS